MIDFLYPTANRDSCDRIVETTEASFSGARSSNESTLKTGAPTLSDLESMVTSGMVNTKSNTGTSLVLPTEQQMLNEPFRTQVANGKIIYIMPRNNSGNGYLGKTEKVLKCGL